MNSCQALGEDYDFKYINHLQRREAELMEELRKMAISPELQQEIDRVNRRARRQTWLRFVVAVTGWGTFAIISAFTYYGIYQLVRLLFRALGAL